MLLLPQQNITNFLRKISRNVKNKKKILNKISVRGPYAFAEYLLEATLKLCKGTYITL